MELELRCAVLLTEGVAGVGGVILTRSPTSLYGQGVELGNALWMYSSYCVQTPRSSDGEII